MGDPWGMVESKLLLAQASLARGAPDARERVEACDVTGLQEREPVQHWHLTRAWLAHREGRHLEALLELEEASVVMGGGLGDHATQLFTRLSSMPWPEPLRERVRVACLVALPATTPSGAASGRSVS
jgi:hypothetical protein